jgi:hypothetical protein
VGVTISYLNPPSNVQATLQAGGSLLADTTYYVVVTARKIDEGFQQSSPWNGNMFSEPSTEISFLTDSTNKSAVITWTAPSGGAACYNVWCTKVSGDYTDNHINYYYSGKLCSTVPYQYSTMTTSYTITQEGQWNGSYACETLGYGTVYNSVDPDYLLGEIPKNTGTVLVKYTGTVTLQDVCDALDAAGKSDYYYYNHNNYFILKGSIYVPASETAVGSLTILKHTLVFFNGGIQIDNANCSLILGEKQVASWINSTGSGCVVMASRVSLSNVKAYNCVFDPLLLPLYEGIITRYYTIVENWNSNVESCVFKNFGSYIGDFPGQFIYTQDTYGYAYENASPPPYNTNQYLGSYIERSAFRNPSGYPVYRDCTFKHTSPEFFMEMGTYDYTAQFYDCYFVGPCCTNYKLHPYSWPTDTTLFKIAYNYSIVLSIVDEDEVGINGATFLLKNNNGDTVFSIQSNSSGDTVKQDVQIHIASHKTGASSGLGEAYTTRIDYNPFTMVVSKSGYETFTKEFELTKKTIERVQLKSVVKTKVSTEGNLLIALQPELGSASQMLEA